MRSPPISAFMFLACRFAPLIWAFAPVVMFIALPAVVTELLLVCASIFWLDLSKPTLAPKLSVAGATGFVLPIVMLAFLVSLADA